MKRTLAALVVFAITSALILKGSFTIKSECGFLMEQAEAVLDSEYVSEEDIYKIEERFEDNSLLWTAVLGNEQKNEMEKTLKTAKKLLQTSQEEGRSLLYSFILELEEMAKSEELNLENII